MNSRSSIPTSRFWKYLFGLLESLLAVLLVVNLLMPDRGYSLVENRPLRQLSMPTWSGLVDGKAGEQLESYVSDQFVGRNFLFHVNYALRRAAGQREIDDVFLGHRALLQQNSLPEPGFLENQIHALNSFSSLIGVPCTVLVAPSAASIQPDRLPAQAPVRDINPALDQLYSSLQTQGADVRTILREHAQDYIFYRTDHHWTTEGAMLAASQLLGTFGITLDEQNFPALEVSDSFQGTLASMTGSFGLDDDIYIAPASNQADYLVTWADGHKTASIYDQDALKQKDQYEVFLGKNQSLVHIETLSDSRENLLLFKDSYANSMIQFLLPYYRNIYIVDPRYYYDDLNYLLSIGNITQCAFVFSSNTFMTDRSLQDVLNSFIQANSPQSEDGSDGADSTESSEESESGESQDSDTSEASSSAENKDSAGSSSASSSQSEDASQNASQSASSSEESQSGEADQPDEQPESEGDEG